MPFPDPLARGNGALIKDFLKSPNYVAGTAGWSINKDGTAEFANAIVRGSVVSGPSGSQVIIGPASDLPPPLDTYLIAGMVLVTATTMSYIGIKDNSPFANLTEYGFVSSNGTIIPMVQMDETNPNLGEWTFVGGVNNQVIFDVMQLVYFGTCGIQQHDGTQIQSSTAGGQMFMDILGKIWQSTGWTIDLTTASALQVDNTSTVSFPGLRPVSSGVKTGDYSWTATTYGITTTAGVYFSVDATFIAPASGQVDLKWRGQLLNSVATNQSFISPVVRAGAVVGAGATAFAASDTTAMICGTTSANPGQTFVESFTQVTGLTPFATYNVRLEHRVNAGTGRTLLGELIVTPSP